MPKSKPEMGRFFKIRFYNDVGFKFPHFYFLKENSFS